MITFAILFLGLVLGTHDVELLVEGDIERVELYLDGDRVAVLQEAPWRTQCDFGSKLRPHSLVAIGFDAQGVEITRIEQRINLPRGRAETALILEGGEPGRPEWARLVWQHMEYQEADKVVLRFDRKPLRVEAERARLPSFDPAELHTLEATIRFPDGVRYQSELTIGGQTMFGAETELTGVALRGRAGHLPDLGDLEGRFVSRGEPLRVVGVERSPARMVMVVEQTALPALRKLGEFGGNLTNTRTALRPGEQLVFLFPEVRKIETRGVPSRLFSMTQEFTAADGSSIPWILTRVAAPEIEPSPYRRISDAIAVAAVEAAQGNRPRAVVLVLGTRADDTSAYSISEARSFLEDLRVPLIVWWTGLPQGEVTSESRRQISHETPWGRAIDISSFTRFMEATEGLRDELERQLTVWVEGSHLPNDIELVAGVKGLEPAG